MIHVALSVICSWMLLQDTRPVCVVQKSHTLVQKSPTLLQKSPTQTEKSPRILVTCAKEPYTNRKKPLDLGDLYKGALHK